MPTSLGMKPTRKEGPPWGDPPPQPAAANSNTRERSRFMVSFSGSVHNPAGSHGVGLMRKRPSRLSPLAPVGERGQIGHWSLVNDQFGLSPHPQPLSPTGARGEGGKQSRILLATASGRVYHFSPETHCSCSLFTPSSPPSAPRCSRGQSGGSDHAPFETQLWIHPHRAAGGDCHYRSANGTAPAGGAKGARRRPPHQVRQQPQTAGDGPAHVPRRQGDLPARAGQPFLPVLALEL